MMVVRTYTGFSEDAIVVLGTKKRLAVHEPPGTWVCNAFRSDSIGLLVANTDVSLTVVWSVYGQNDD